MSSRSRFCWVRSSNSIFITKLILSIFTGVKTLCVKIDKSKESEPMNDIWLLEDGFVAKFILEQNEWETYLG